MSKLGAVVEAVEKHGRFVLEQVKRARSDEKFAQAVTERWNKVKAEIPIAKAPTGLPLPRLALPEIDEVGRGRGEERLPQRRGAEARAGRAAQDEVLHGLEAQRHLAVGRAAEVAVVLVAPGQAETEAADDVALEVDVGGDVVTVLVDLVDRTEA